MLGKEKQTASHLKAWWMINSPKKPFPQGHFVSGLTSQEILPRGGSAVLFDFAQEEKGLKRLFI